MADSTKTVTMTEYLKGMTDEELYDFYTLNPNSYMEQVKAEMVYRFIASVTVTP